MVGRVRRDFDLVGLLQAIGRRLAGALVNGDFIRNLLAFIERAHAGTLNSTDVHENIRAAGVWLNEAEAFL